MSGAILLLCCGSVKAQSPAEHCPIRKNHCERAKNKGESPLLSGRTAVDCCHFPAAFFDKARKINSLTLAAHPAASANFAAPQFSAVDDFRPVTIPYRAPVLDRGATYLKNRVLRI